MESLIEKIVDGTITDSQLEECSILCREAKMAHQILLNPEAFQTLISKQDNVYALKALANILYFYDEARSKFGYTSQFESLLTNIDEILVNVEKDIEIDYVRLRILFIATIKSEVAEKAFSIMDSLVMVNPSSSEKILLEVLRIMFNTAAIKKHPGAVPFAWRCLEHESVKIVANAFNLLLYTDVEIAIPKVSIIIVALVKLFKQYECFSDKKSKTEYQCSINTAFLALTRYAAVNNTLRRDLRRSLLPGRTPSNYKALFTSIFQSQTEPLSQATGDFFLTLLNGKLSRLIFHFGYGTLAGFMYERGLLGDSNQLDSISDLAGESSDEELILEGGLDKLDLVTGKEATFTTNAEEAPWTEAEKEEEAERLYKLFQKLEKSEIITVCKKTE